MIIRLLKPLEKAIKAGHPWIFRNALHPFTASPGEVVTVQDRSGRFLCRGLADAGPIGVRVFSTSDVPLDAALLRQRIQKALRLRDAIRPGQTTALRLISGEGDRLPGVTVDQYGPYAVLVFDGSALDTWKEHICAALREELGDLLFQILFLVVMAEESREFTLADVMNDVAEKMVRRHPHVFGDRKVRDVDEIKANWKDIKENLENKHPAAGLLDGIPRSLPSLLRAQKMTERASRVGFDWSVTEDVLVKVEEELCELKAALKDNQSEKVREEMGDLLFSLVNLSRFADVNADDALRRANQKFADRFSYMESKLAIQGKTPGQVSREEMDRLWDECKTREKG